MHLIIKALFVAAFVFFLLAALAIGRPESPKRFIAAGLAAWVLTNILSAL